jgi:hypothetical protein
MGPFIVKPRNRQTEIDRIVGLLQSSGWRESNWHIVDQLHYGTFRRETGLSSYSHIQCHTCGWHSEGPVVQRYSSDYEECRRIHTQQYRVHRAEMALDAGVNI